jgi:hypothetical protein
MPMQRRVAIPLVAGQIHNAVMTIQSVYLVQIHLDFVKDRIHVVQQDKCAQVMERHVQFARVAQRVVVMGVIQVALKYVAPTIKQFAIAIRHVVMAIAVMQAQHV